MEILGLIILWIGIGFSAIGILGLLRLPDMYTRLHASGKVSTVGLIALLLGAALLMPSTLLKVVALALFAMLTLPVSTHAIALAGYRSGVRMSWFGRDDLKHRERSSETVELAEERSAA
ncbi:MAG: monovalent cation/H(+) antiporter subunit G [Chloroflexi bacterium]|nr:monovalent cation/H(+) antiporter subunit G [Chloroflexota bacterium]